MSLKDKAGVQPAIRDAVLDNIAELNQTVTTASASYVQAEAQAVSNKVQDASAKIDAVIAALVDKGWMEST
jgi:hypothetical protein